MKKLKIPKDVLHFTEDEKDEVLKNFMKEFFHFPSLCKVGFFTKEMKGDYKAQAERVCRFFGYKTVFEYGAKTTEGIHLSYAKGKKPDNEPFAFKIKSIYEP